MGLLVGCRAHFPLEEPTPPASCVPSFLVAQVWAFISSANRVCRPGLWIGASVTKKQKPWRTYFVGGGKGLQQHQDFRGNNGVQCSYGQWEGIPTILFFILAVVLLAVWLTLCLIVFQAWFCRLFRDDMNYTTSFQSMPFLLNPRDSICCLHPWIWYTAQVFTKVLKTGIV